MVILKKKKKAGESESIIPSSDRITEELLRLQSFFSSQPGGMDAFVANLTDANT